MNIYKAPNLIISPKSKVYRRLGRRHSTINPSTHTRIHTFSLSLSLTLPFPLYPLPPPNTHSHTPITVSGREGYWDGKRCVFSADLKANVELE